MTENLQECEDMSLSQIQEGLHEMQCAVDMSQVNVPQSIQVTSISSNAKKTRRTVVKKGGNASK